MIPDSFRSTRENVNINREGPNVLKQCISLTHMINIAALKKIKLDAKQKRTHYIMCTPTLSKVENSNVRTATESFSNEIDTALKY